MSQRSLKDGMRAIREQMQQPAEGGEVNDTALDIMQIMTDRDLNRRDRQMAVQNGLISVEGGLVYRSFKMTATGIESAEGATDQDWTGLMGLMMRLEGSVQWILGDLILMGESVWGKTYDDMVRITGKDQDTLIDYVYVARNVHFSVRTEQLSFSHHKLVASMPEDEQIDWLSKALVGKWSVDTLRKQIKGKAEAKAKAKAKESLLLAEEHQNAIKRIASLEIHHLKDSDPGSNQERVNEIEGVIEALYAVRDLILEQIQG